MASWSKFAVVLAHTRSYLPPDRAEKGLMAAAKFRGAPPGRSWPETDQPPIRRTKGREAVHQLCLYDPLAQVTL